MNLFVLQESNPLLAKDAVWGPNLDEFRKEFTFFFSGSL
jgi:hypothetical protein